MAKTLTQTVLFKNTTPETLYDIYMNAKKHASAIGSAVSIKAKEGTTFSAHGGYIKGKNFQLTKGKHIVQSWRSADFKSGEPDSTFILKFEKKGNDALLHMVHANIPEAQFKGIKNGWNDYYWKPWKKYLTMK